MTVSYTDNFGNILTGIGTLLKNEESEDVFISDQYEGDGFHLNPTETRHHSGTNAGEVREYDIEITYYVDAAPGRDRISHLLDRYGWFNRLVQNNDEYRVSGVLRWFNARLSICAFGVVDESKPNHGQFRTTLTCSLAEII